MQAALPFKSKPKIEAPRKRETLEQRRAVVMEPEEKKLATLVQQLNTIRNDRAVKKREVQAVKRGARQKVKAKEEAWRAQHSKVGIQQYNNVAPLIVIQPIFEPSFLDFHGIL